MSFLHIFFFFGGSESGSTNSFLDIFTYLHLENKKKKQALLLYYFAIVLNKNQTFLDTFCVSPSCL